MNIDTVKMAENLSEEKVAKLQQAFNEFEVDGGDTINTIRAMGMNTTENEFLKHGSLGQV